MINVSCKNLTKIYPRPDAADVVALQKLSLTLPAGDITALVGRSGCGKTTLLRLIAGLETPNTGSIEFIDAHQKQTHAKLAVVFQEHRLFPWMNVRENLRMAVRDLPTQEQERRIEDVLTLIGLTDFAHSYPQELSGGMSQRVGFARALVSQPDVLLMDEPFSALDALTRHQLYREFIDVYLKRPMTVLLITHDVTEAVLLSRHIIQITAEKQLQHYECPQPYPRHLSTPGLTELSDRILDRFSQKKEV